jgi:hypothetical protein
MLRYAEENELSLTALMRSRLWIFKLFPLMYLHCGWYSLQVYFSHISTTTQELLLQEQKNQNQIILLKMHLNVQGQFLYL